MGDGDERWWSTLTCDINGVFKGGGAKGLLYAGALQAVAKTGHWFHAVAGASAGAITASLIAAGVSPDRFAELAAEGLGKITRNYWFDLAGQPHVKTGHLRDWLEGVLVDQVVTISGPRASDGLVSFDELYQASGVELFVVCVDVAMRQPRVFGSELTPALSVTDAIIASSSIPFAFHPARLRVASTSGIEEIHRLMDGGVWANYPTFVFKDPSFRAFHELPELPPTSVTVGFTLDSAHVDMAGGAQPVILERTPLNRHDKGAGLKGWLRNPFIRIYFLTFVPLVIAIEFLWTASHYGLLVLKDNARDLPDLLQGAAGWIDGFVTSMWPGTWSVALVIVALALLLMLLGATVIDSAFPAMRTLLAVGTDVPYWSGASATDRVVRLSVPEGLTTLSFTPDRDQVPAWIDEARESAQQQLGQMGLSVP